MAHKTFSQEQFIIKYYFVTFQTETRELSDANPRTLNEVMLIANTFLRTPTFAGTNMLVLYRVRSRFSSGDSNFFSYLDKISI